MESDSAYSERGKCQLHGAEKESQADLLARLLGEVQPIHRMQHKTPSWQERSHALVEDILHDPHGLLQSGLSKLAPPPQVTHHITRVKSWMERLMNEYEYDELDFEHGECEFAADVGDAASLGKEGARIDGGDDSSASEEEEEEKEEEPQSGMWWGTLIGAVHPKQSGSCDEDRCTRVASCAEPASTSQPVPVSQPNIKPPGLGPGSSIASIQRRMQLDSLLKERLSDGARGGAASQGAGIEDEGGGHAAESTGRSRGSAAGSRTVVGQGEAASRWWQEEMQTIGRITTIIRQLMGKKIMGSGLESAATFDPLAALIVWREQRERAAFARRCDLELNAHRDPSQPVPPLEPMRRALQLACAAYGVLGQLHLAKLGDLNHTHFRQAVQRMAASDGSVAAAHDTAAAAALAGLPQENILVAEWSPMAFSPCCYLAVDHSMQWIVLSIRGTACAGDTLTDCCAEPVPFLDGHAHAGIAAATWQLVAEFVPRVAAALARHSGYQAVLTGHSMGAGVAALLAMLLHSQDADVTAAVRRGVESVCDIGESQGLVHRVLEATRSALCYAIAAPCVCTLALSQAAVPYVTTLVAGKDVVCRLSISNVQQLVVKLNNATPLQPVLRAVAQVLGPMPGGDSPSSSSSSHHALGDSPTPSTIPTRDHFVSESAHLSHPGVHEASTSWADSEMGLEMRDLYSPTYLVPPGLIVHMRHITSGAPVAEVRPATAFTEIPMSTRMMSDHVPKTYVETLDLLLSFQKTHVNSAAVSHPDEEAVSEGARHLPKSEASVVWDMFDLQNSSLALFV